MNKGKLIFIGLVAILVLYLTFSYFFGNEEAKIKDIFDEARMAFNKEDNGSLFADVSLEYQNERGIKYLPAKYIMKQFFSRTDNVNLRIPNISIIVSGKEATAELEIILTGAKRGRGYHVLGKPGDPVIIVVGLKKGLTGWKVHSTKNVRPSKAYLRGEQEE
jgi:hypothetical protein